MVMSSYNTKCRWYIQYNHPKNHRIHHTINPHVYIFTTKFLYSNHIDLSTKGC